MTEPVDTEREAEVVDLPVEPLPPVLQPVPEPPRGLHALAVGGMALFALAGIGSLLALITVEWTQELRRFVMGGFIFAVVAFMACASIAVFSAARSHASTHGSDPGARH